MVPPGRLELPTSGLRVRCATIALRRDGFVNIFFYVPSRTIRGSRMTLEFTSFHSVAFLVYVLIIQHFTVAVNLFLPINTCMSPEFFCKTIDLPALPNALAAECLAITEDASQSYIAGTSQVGTSYNRYRASDAIYQWVLANVDSKIRNNMQVGIQTFRPLQSDAAAWSPHTDGPRGQYILNYLIDAGGSNVLTKWYQEAGKPLVRAPGITLVGFSNLTEMHTEHIQPGTWFCLYSRVLHTVVNVERPRISLSIGVNSQL